MNKMALDPKYVVTSDLESYYVDKDSGAPLAGGIITFYRDTSRSVKKTVFQISEPTPGNFTYTALPNPCILSDVGTFQDALGNNIVPYYYPYDDNGDTDLYYITVQSSSGITQFVRIGWPNNPDSTDNTTEADTKNYIPNGQFLAHNNIVNVSGTNSTEPPVTGITYGIGTLNRQAIAQGGWNFNLTSGSLSVFSNSFSSLTSWPSGIHDYPRNAFNLKCVSYDSGTTSNADLTISFPGVNTLSGLAPDGVSAQPYTLFFAAGSNTVSSYVINVYAVYYFGSGGGAHSPIETLLGSFNVGPTYTIHTQNIAQFIPYVGPTYQLGTSGDDYVGIIIRGPQAPYDMQFTDFALVAGIQSINTFPSQTNAEALSQGVAGWMPTPDSNGLDMYLPLVLTPSGMTFDRSIVGTIVAKPTSTAENNELPCNGTAYLGGSFSSLGIPYSRLRDKLITNSAVTTVPMYGTGTNFATAYALAGNTSILRIVVNKLGVVTAANAGTSGFTATRVHIGATTVGFTAYNNIANTVLALGSFFPPPFGAATAGTSPFTVTTNSITTGLLAEQVYSITILTVAAAAMVAGQYFLFSNAATNYYMWFKIGGAGADPAVGGATGIEVDILASYTAQDVANAVKEAMNELESSTITVGALPTASTYWTFTANPGGSPVTYYVWYQISSSADPAPGGTGIKVVLTGSETNPQIVSKTQVAINNYQFATPDLRGMFLRALDASGTYDGDVAQRWSTVTGISGANLGTFEYAQLIAHNHTLEIDQSNGATVKARAGDNTSIGSQTTTTTGGNETRPVNAAVNYYIKY